MIWLVKWSLVHVLAWGIGWLALGVCALIGAAIPGVISGTGAFFAAAAAGWPYHHLWIFPAVIAGAYILEWVFPRLRRSGPPAL